MADNRKYYYMRLKEGYFDDDAVKILEAMPDGYLYSNILLKLYLKSLKFDGCLMFNERIPYNPTVLATITRHQVGTIEKALEIFKSLDLIEILDNGAIYMLDIQNLIGKSSTEADRKKEYRARIEAEKHKLLTDGQTVGHLSGQTPPEIEKEIEKEIEIKKETKRIDYQQIADMYNETCVSFPSIKSLSDARKKAIKARLKTYSVDDFKTCFEKAESSDFLKGGNDRNWTASFDWMIKDANMAKILDGNYDNKPKKTSGRKEPVPEWMNKNKNKFNNFDQRKYDMDNLERQMLGVDAGLQQRVEELKERLGAR